MSGKQSIPLISQELFELVISSTGLGVWDWQIQTNQMTINEHWAQQIGYHREDFQPFPFETLRDLMHEDDLSLSESRLFAHWQGKDEQYNIEFRIRHKDGHYVWIQSTGQVIEWNDAGEPVRMIGINLDISQRKLNEETMTTTAKLLEQSQTIAKVGGWELDLTTGYLFWTDETYRIHDTSPEEFDPTVDAGVSYFLPESQKMITDALDAAINRGEGYDLELETYTTKGRKIDVRTTGVVTMEDGKAVKITGIFQDITDQKTIQRNLQQTNLELEQLNFTLQNSAHYDALTNLPNRNLLADRMQQAISRQQRHGNIVAIAFVDLDGFKEVNDLYGHSLGDKLLCQVADLLKKVLREEDTLARFGGDEFVAVLDNMASFDICDQVLQRMLNAMRRPFFIDGHHLSVSASIGVTLYPQDNNMADQLIRHADQAMYIAKQLGKNQYHVFDVAKDVAFKHQHEERAAIRRAIEQDEFVLYFQPKTNLATAEVVGVEALIRWQHPQEGLLPPGAFLPIIEQDPLIIALGEKVIRAAIAQHTCWRKAGLNMPISVNISPLQLQQEAFSNNLRTLLADYADFRDGSIIFEILETAALSDLEQVAKVIDECQTLGIQFSIDDFGTGYSSLTYLKKLHAKQLKIDRSFVRDMLEDADDEAIVQGIIELARVFDLDVVAEGVETLEHGRKLFELGCEFAQGFGIARPMPGEQIPAWLQQWHGNLAWHNIDRQI